MLTEEAGVILHDTPTDYFSEYMAAALATLNKNVEENEFFNEGILMKEFADIAASFGSGAQMSNAKLGMAHAATLNNLKYIKSGLVSALNSRRTQECQIIFKITI